MRYLKTCLLLLSLLLLLSPMRLQAFVAPAQVQVESEWGDANPDDVKAVLNSVIEAISPYMAGRTFGNIIVRNDKSGPISLYEKSPNDEYIVLLNVNGRYWAQLAYQFSHEMCHLMSNYDLAPNNITRQQWFEESLCEAFSLFALEKMAQQWASNPPYPHWQEYAPKFTEYQQDMFKQTHRQLPNSMKLPKWYQAYAKTLSADPYAQGRDLNELVANQLLPIFTEQPEAWTTLNYLNLGDDSDDKSLRKYLTDWENNLPSKWQPTVEEIQQILIKPAQ
ncbi:MAG: hypothetical protein QJT81_20770 [Candidatus Thiothrix putei]|uniref:Uncharacterized protein n=1 Tax=Candidatus Thiothrix putei TaxID=3080811 RepID=A0AA95KM83_9GAMM|nr:MAG: hypothetical protein QJT81_20770 [Candidatus Thiothrix putei]